MNGSNPRLNRLNEKKKRVARRLDFESENEIEPSPPKFHKWHQKHRDPHPSPDEEDERSPPKSRKHKHPPNYPPNSRHDEEDEHLAQ